MTKERKLKKNLNTDKCKERGDSNSGHVGLVDFLSEKDTRFLHSHGNESRRQKILHVHKRQLKLYGV